MPSPKPSLLLAVFLLLVLIWGTTWAAVRVTLDGIPPFTGVALRFAMAALVLLALAYFQRVPLGRARHERRLWLINAALSFCGSYGIVHWSEQWLPTGIAAIIFATFPLFVTLLAHFFLLHERITGVKLAGLVVGFLGVAVIYSEDFEQLGGPMVGLAAVVMLGSPLVSSVANVAVKRWGRDVHPISLTAVPMALTAVVMGALALVTEGTASLRLELWPVLALVYLGLCGTALTFTLYYWLLAHVPATRVALMAFLTPVVAVACGWLLFAEPITSRTLVGAALVLAGVALAVFGRQRADLRATASDQRAPQS